MLRKNRPTSEKNQLGPIENFKMASILNFKQNGGKTDRTKKIAFNCCDNFISN